jgi:hypothetical protein
VLKDSQDRDVVTLWHLLPRVDAGQRRRVYDRMLEFATPPDGVTAQGIVALNSQMLDRWKSDLGLVW